MTSELRPKPSAAKTPRCVLLQAGMREFAAPNVKQRLAAIRHLFDWLVTGQAVPVNPAGSVRGPRHVVTCVQTPVRDPRADRPHGLEIGGEVLLEVVMARHRMALAALPAQPHPQSRRLCV